MKRLMGEEDQGIQSLLEEVFKALFQDGQLPKMDLFLAAHRQNPHVQSAFDRFFLRDQSGWACLTWLGLLELDTDPAREQIRECDVARLLIKEKVFQEDVNARSRSWTPAQLAEKTGLSEATLKKLLSVLATEPGVGLDDAGRDGDGHVRAVHLRMGLIETPPLDWVRQAAELNEAMVSSGLRLREIQVSGYRTFRDFKASLDPLTVVIGANATGKSSLLDFLKFLRSAVAEPLPPEIDRNSVGRTLFHAGGPGRISFSLGLDVGLPHLLRYEASIDRPEGHVRVPREAAEMDGDRVGNVPLLQLMNFAGGKGTVYGSRHHQNSWTLAQNELALRRAQDPNLTHLSRVREYLESWKFYSGFDVSQGASIRTPVKIIEEPTLDENGANLSAVLMSFVTEHRELWEELETHLRSVVPGFRALTAKARGGPGDVMGVWREEGVNGELTLADLSDGTLRFLCLAVLCLAPKPPPLMCLDEPEVGLHPRVLPVLAGLMRQASERTQLLVTTHSPYFLSQFSINEIAVMRKEEGRALLLRPGSRESLRQEVEELGGEALAQLHISDELETRS